MARPKSGRKVLTPAERQAARRARLKANSTAAPKVQSKQHATPSRPKTLGELPVALGADTQVRRKRVVLDPELHVKTTKTADEPKRHPVGRPTKFEDEMCQRAYEMSVFGASEKVMAAALGIDVSTLREWTKTRPEFSLALLKGRALASGRVAASILDAAAGHVGPDGKYYAPSLGHARWYMSVKARNEWPLVNEAGAQLNVGITNVNAPAPTPEEAHAIYHEFMNPGRPAPPYIRRTIQHYADD